MVEQSIITLIVFVCGIALQGFDPHRVTGSAAKILGSAFLFTVGVFAIARWTDALVSYIIEWVWTW